MSNTKYLEFTSTRRNRVLYPYPSKFVITQAEQKTTVKNALDPVCLAYPINTWYTFEQYLGNIEPPSSPLHNLYYTIDNSVLIINATYTPFTPVLPAIPPNLSTNKDFYVGACIAVTNNITGESNTRRITSYKYLGLDDINSPAYTKAVITVSPPFPDSLNIEKASMNPGDCTFSITCPTDLSDPNYPLIFVPNGSPYENSYINYYVFFIFPFFSTEPAYAKIIGYNEVTRLIKLEPTSIDIINKLSIASNLCIRKELPSYYGGVGPFIDLYHIDMYGGSLIPDFYTNYWIRVTPGQFSGDPSPSRIISYSPTVATLLTPLTAIPDDTSVYEILEFSYDNVFPFTYNGSEKETSYYRVELVNIILPNIVLANAGYGGRIAYYPYIYVKVNNISAFGGQTNLIMSNNPNANSMTFRCPINDTNYPEKSPFINVYGNGISQVFQFAPSDDLEFEVTLPNGELFKTEMQDFYSPSEPNFQVQISAIFSLEKIK